MATRNTHRSVLAYFHSATLQDPAPPWCFACRLWLRGKEVFSFEYDRAWLESGRAQNLDPDLQLYSGPHYWQRSKKQLWDFHGLLPGSLGENIDGQARSSIGQNRRKEAKPTI